MKTFLNPSLYISSQASQSLSPSPPPHPSQGEVLWKSEMEQEAAMRDTMGDHGLQRLLASFSHSDCSSHKSLPSLSSFPQLLLLSMLTLETHSLGCVLHEVRVMAGNHPAHQLGCFARHPRSHCVTVLELAAEQSYEIIC